ncbi:hypothetical protein GGI1_19374, partial [Acidithiobacillus sp. GGI-221]
EEPLVVSCYDITLSVIIVSMDIALYLTPQPIQTGHSF